MVFYSLDDACVITIIEAALMHYQHESKARK